MKTISNAIMQHHTDDGLWVPPAYNPPRFEPRPHDNGTSVFSALSFLTAEMRERLDAWDPSPEDAYSAGTQLGGDLAELVIRSIADARNPVLLGRTADILNRDAKYRPLVIGFYHRLAAHLM